MPDERINRAEGVLKAILDEVRRGKVHLYLSILKQPYVFLDIHDRPAGCYPLFDPAMRHWLAAFAWDKKLGLLRNQEIDRILAVLAGWSLAAPVARSDDPALLRVIEAEPVVAVVLEFMRSQQSPRIERMMHPLWEELQKFARERGLLKLGHRRFPGGANVLSRLLKSFIPIFKLLGIKIEIARSDGSKVTLTLLDDSWSEPSASSSSDNSAESNNLSPEDDRERRRALLQARKNRDSHHKEGESSR